MLAGVCGGLANWLGWDATLVRVAYVLLSILSAGFPGTTVFPLSPPAINAAYVVRSSFPFFFSGVWQAMLFAQLLLPHHLPQRLLPCSKFRAIPSS